MQRCRIQFAGDPTAHIPLVVEELSTPSVIAMEFIEGVSVDDLAGIRRLQAVPAEVAVTGARILLRQIFEFGFFHADPHPGNLRVLEGGVIAPLDYGMFGQLDGKTRERIADLLSGLLAQDSDRVIRSLSALDIRGEKLDSRGVSPRRRRAGRRLIPTLTLDTIDLSLLLRELVAVIRTHHLHIPARPGPLDPLARDHRGGRPHARSSFRHRQPARAVHSRSGPAPISPRSDLEPDGADHRRPSAHRHAVTRSAQPVARFDQTRRASRCISTCKASSGWSES